MQYTNSFCFTTVLKIIVALLITGSSGLLNAEPIVDWSGNYMQQPDNGSFNRIYRGGHLSSEPTIVTGIDVNDDGEITDEAEVFWEFDIINETLNPLSSDDPRVTPGNQTSYHTEFPHAEFFGGIRMQFVNIDFLAGEIPYQSDIQVERFLGDNLPTEPETVMTLLPLGREAPGPDDLMNFHAVFLWPTVPAVFDGTSRIGVTLTRWLMPDGEARFVVMDGNQLYISESTLGTNGALPGDSGVFNRRELSPLEENWATYDPVPPRDFDFDQSGAVFEPHDFEAIRMAGIYFENDGFVQDPNNDGKWFNLGFKFIEFLLDATPLPNRAPELSSIGSQVVNEEEFLTFSASATDADGSANTLTFSLDQGAPEGAAIDPETGVFTWTPTESQGPGDYEVTIRVTDDGVPNLDDFEMIIISVNEVNTAPVLDSIGNQTVLKEMLITFAANAVDVDFPENTLTFSLDEGAPEDVSIDPMTGLFTWTPDNETVAGNYDIIIRVTDNGVPILDDFEMITIAVTEVNIAPELETIGNQTVNEQELLTFTVTATDSNLPAHNLVFSLDSDAPEGAAIDPETGVFTWTPSEDQGPFDHPVTIRVTDDGIPNLEDFEMFNISVTEINTAPELAAIGNQTTIQNELLTFTAMATDTDLPLNNLNFSLEAGAPEGAAIDPESGVFTWTPSEDQEPGDYPITIRVTDDGPSNLNDFESITIRVIPEAEVIVDWSGNYMQQPDNGSFNRIYRGGHLSGEPTIVTGIDVNDDGEITEEAEVFWEFDILNETLNPLSADDPRVTPGNQTSYHTEFAHAKFFGGIRMQFVNIDFLAGEIPYQSDIQVERFLGDNLPTEPETVMTLLPLGREAPGPDDLMNFHAVFLWPTVPAIFAETSRIGVTLTRWLMPDGEARFVVMDGNQLYISESTMATNGGLPGDLGVFNRREISPVDDNWAVYNPVPPRNIDFDQSDAVFAPHVFEDVRMAGIYFENDDFVQDPNNDGRWFNLGFKFIEFAVEATPLPNRPPELSPIGNQMVNEEELLAFTAMATDADGSANTLTFSLDEGAPEGAAIDPDTGVFTWTPTEIQGPGDYVITVRVTDNGSPSLDDFEMITVSVNEVNTAPELNAIGNQIAQKDTSITFSANAMDADLPENNLTFSLDEGAPQGASIDPNTGIFTWTPGTAFGAGDYEITVRVTDDGVPNLDDFELITITLELNADEWLFAIDVTNADKPNVSFGMQSGATDFFDDNMFDIAASPNPPEFNGGIYLLQNSQEFTQDSRAISDEAEWLLAVIPNGNDMELSWDETSIPEGKFLSFYEVNVAEEPISGPSFDMREISQLLIPDGPERFFKIRYASSMRITISFSRGWNLISLPITPTSPLVEEIFISGNGLDEGSGPIFKGKVWGWEEDKLNASSTVTALQGYWIYTLGNPTITVDGNAPNPDEDEKVIVDEGGHVEALLEMGWNLIGPIIPTDISYPLTLPLQGVIWSWDGKRFRAADKMDVDKGYWINALEANSVSNPAQ